MHRDLGFLSLLRKSWLLCKRWFKCRSFKCYNPSTCGRILHHHFGEIHSYRRSLCAQYPFSLMRAYVAKLCLLLQKSNRLTPAARSEPIKAGIKICPSRLTAVVKRRWNGWFVSGVRAYFTGCALYSICTPFPSDNRSTAKAAKAEKDRSCLTKTMGGDRSILLRSHWSAEHEKF